MKNYRAFEEYLDKKEKELGLSIDDKATAILLKLDYLISEMEQQQYEKRLEAALNAQYEAINKMIEAAN